MCGMSIDEYGILSVGGMCSHEFWLLLELRKNHRTNNRGGGATCMEKKIVCIYIRMAVSGIAKVAKDIS